MQGQSIQSHRHSYSGTTGDSSSNPTVKTDIKHSHSLQGTSRASSDSVGLNYNSGYHKACGVGAVKWDSNIGTYYTSTDGWGNQLVSTEGSSEKQATVSGTHTHSFSGDTSYEGSTETRPSNYTIKIWLRTN